MWILCNRSTQINAELHIRLQMIYQHFPLQIKVFKSVVQIFDSASLTLIPLNKTHYNICAIPNPKGLLGGNI